MTPVLVSKTVDVPLNVQDAFELFTKGLDSWWPVAHGTLKLEPRKGGKLTENGQEVGTILAFDPDGFLAFTWKSRLGDEETIVTVAFIATPDGCRVELTHGSEAILGDVTDAVSTSYLSNFDLVLGSYCTCAKSALVNA